MVVITKGFQPGHAKVGGREKGTPNKARNEVRAVIEAEGINLVEEFIENLKNYPHNPIAQNAHILKLMEWVYPKCKQTDDGMTVFQAFEVVKDDLRKRGIVLPIRGDSSSSGDATNIREDISIKSE
jgi:hypothetical protein